VKTALLSFTLAAIACYVFGFALYEQLSRWNMMDHPNARSSHSRPTVRGGGIGIVAAVGFGWLLLISRGTESNMLLVIGPIGLVLAIISFLDDLRSVPAYVRFGFHAAAGFGVLYGLGLANAMFEMSPDASYRVPLTVAVVVGFLWIVGYTNAFNFMDGINGIATSQAIMTATGSALLAVLSGASWTALPILFAFIVAGAAAGFMPHNFPTARMFMGDVSSAPLGFVLSALALWLARDYGWWLLLPLGFI
jgi:UDP-N-acetylmuramyl pentapeptide phosphotransferase/UDP-N-acetylglucosamine-1-phosphate transferase